MANAANIAAATAMLEAADPAPVAAEAPVVETTVEGATPEPKAAAPVVEQTEAEIRKLRLQTQLADLRVKSEARKAKLANDTSAKDLEKQRTELAAEKARVDARAAEWDGVENDPVKIMKARGLDVGDAFAKLAEAAQTANTPEAKIEAQAALIAAQNKRIDDFLESQKAEKEAAKAAELEAQKKSAVQSAERELLEHMKGDDYKTTRAFFKDDAALVAYAHKVADRQRAAGHSPSYESISKEIEQEAKELHAHLSSSLGSNEAGSSSGGTPPQSVRGKGAQVVSTPRPIGNELATASASNSGRKKTLAERQADAERLLPRP